MAGKFTAFFLIIVFVQASCFADARGDFDRAYAEYQQYMEDQAWEQALSAAAAAYRHGEKAFGRDNINTGNLAFNYGRLLNRFDRADKAATVLEQSLVILEKFHGDDSSRLADVLIELGKAHWDPEREERAMDAFKRAVELAATESAAIRAQLNLAIGLFLSNKASSPLSVAFLERAHQIYRDRVGVRDVRTALAQMHLARWAMADGKFEEGRQLLQIPLEVFEAHPDNAPLELIARSLLVNALEYMGDRDDATQHCLIIGERLAPPESKTEYTPLVKVQPQYPRNALVAGRSGWVVVEFTVDQEGFTRDPRVVESSGGKLFHGPAIEAVHKFRYAPRFEDGKAVATTGIINKITFDITK